MSTRVFLVLLLLISIQYTAIARGHSENPGQINLFSHEGEITTVLFNSDSGVNMSQARDNLMNGIPVVFYGNDSFNIYDLFSPEYVIENRTRTGLRLVASGLWLQEEGNTSIEHQIQVYDSSLTQLDMNSIYSWLNETKPVTTPTGYRIEALITQIDHHEPYGVLETETDILKVLDDNNEYDWYDASVTQNLIPGANYTSSSWEWGLLQYTMNGSLGSSNVYLSDYDPPPSNEVPEGPFSFLWRILGFDLRDFIPWLSPSEPRVVGVDLSDFSLELFRTRYEAPRNYRYKNEPFEIRHHYVLRIEEDKAPRFWHQTQAQYIQADDYAQIPYITPPLALGYIAKLK